MQNILITGGAGFMGIHLCNELISHGYKVTVLDNLSPHVHGLDAERPHRIHKDVELIVGDIRDVFTVEPLVKKADMVVHLAAIGSDGKSMDQIQELHDVNNIGTSVLLESLIRNPVQKLILASSMSLYGEGYYTDSGGVIYQNLNRSPTDLLDKKWDFKNAQGELLVPIACKEDHSKVFYILRIKLVRWARYRYKRYRNNLTNAHKWLDRVRDQYPSLFYHWYVGYLN
ncbi:NAD-dependent epimerase/dehydratase family protein [Algoriphagus sp. AGSA1]|uniref:NAD-dependent epimerase/dehydratase family protein n=1 Tax=Algoriphagus sp. AGSA1 TaxID=2907213 RepID=UPI001F423E94|nr:NAD-dependent epimerase/dehydratase family protein [Algoriphagus sp. AGSA1]MCE7054681.1 NAD-dependent epimerase/dehydratase family protein [Algoriphagus sp. AGSA1]